VELVAAAKARRPEEVGEAVEAGVRIVGENYVQDAEKVLNAIGSRVKWHFIGHLQRNKIKKAVGLFDVIQTVDSISLAREIDRRCGEISKAMPVLIEVNSGREPQKAGVLPEDVEPLVREMAPMPNIKVMGLMTMGPLACAGEGLRPYFALTRKTFDSIKRMNLPNTEMGYLSMGMSDSYLVAIDEGANMVRVGRAIFA
jgi:pyridoxal phosphate enzyme (YggS family)